MFKPDRRSVLTVLLGVVCGLAPAAMVLGLNPRAALGQEIGVTISGLAYSPPVLTTTVGSTVRWTHQDGFAVHTVTADNGAFGSPNLSEGDSFTTTFTTTAAYTYHCVFHAGMIGVIQVVDLSQRLYIPSLSRGPAS